MTSTDQDCTTTPHRGNLVKLPSNAGLDRIARLAARTFTAPMAAVALNGESCLWLVARTGPLPPMLPGTPPQNPIVINDLWADPCRRTPLLSQLGIRFWAAAPIVGADGVPLGAVCVMDTVPRRIGPDELDTLQDLAALASTDMQHKAGRARLDPLSGLPDRHELLAALNGSDTDTSTAPRLLALIDLARPDELSQIVQAIGSEELDGLVRESAACLRQLVGRDMRLFHLATLQFALLTAPGADAAMLTQSLQHELPRHGVGRARLFTTTCTAGLAVVCPGEASAEDLLRRAHMALDDARDRYAPVGIYAPDQNAAGRRAFRLINDFGAALEDGTSLRLVFQPRLELANGRCVGVEALLRWNHPEYGEVSPGEFVRLIEKTTMARGMMRWVLKEALRNLRDWRDQGLALQLSVNVSPANLDEPDFSGHVLDCLAESGLPVTALELEVTESALLDEASPALHQLRLLSIAGVRIAIDDFGTGYSSLSYLQRLPADVVKIDQSFVRGLTRDGADDGQRRILVTAMIALSHDLGYRVVAEGIETQAAADALRHLKCDEVQGYLFARPMPAAAFLDWLDQRPWQPRRSQLEPLLVAKTAAS